MQRAKVLPDRNRPGSTLVVSLVLIAILSTLAAALAGFSGANVQIAENLRRADTTRSCAESGLEVMRYWMSKVAMSGTIAPEQRFSQLAAKLQNELTAAGITNLVPVYNGTAILISNVPLRSNHNQSFSAVLTDLGSDTVRLQVTGRDGALQRTACVNYVFGERAHIVFDYGLASRGPIHLSGNIELSGYNISVESNAYIESPDSLLALSIIGNSMIAGEVKVVNPSGYIFLQGGAAGIGGETGAAAMNHVEIGATPSYFPEMVPGPLQSYATNVLDPALDLTKSVTLTNMRIPANTNPKFTSQTTLKGVTFIETPNVVEFAGGVNVAGIIVTNGDQTDDSGTCRLKFTGNITSQSVATLPVEPQFAGLHEQTGTFILAPGFAVDFGAAFGTLNGVIAANGVTFSGGAGGTIAGSVVNYSNNTMELSGNSDLLFNRSGLDEMPAGFVPQIVLHYDPSSYSEMKL
jgi:type II secretory pathway pseudopilin PulG